MASDQSSNRSHTSKTSDTFDRSVFLSSADLTQALTTLEGWLTVLEQQSPQVQRLVVGLLAVQLQVNTTATELRTSLHNMFISDVASEGGPS